MELAHGPESTTKSFSSATFAQYGVAFVVCALTEAVALTLHGLFDLSNIGMLALLAVFFVPTRCNRGPAVIS